MVTSMVRYFNKHANVFVSQRQQVVMTEQLAKTHANIHFSVMHPGWVNTPG